MCAHILLWYLPQYYNHKSIVAEVRKHLARNTVPVSVAVIAQSDMAQSRALHRLVGAPKHHGLSPAPALFTYSNNSYIFSYKAVGKNPCVLSYHKQ